jgi:hypothetical protein
LNLRLPWALKFTEITALVPFSTATPAINNYRVPAFRVKQRKAAQTSGG